MKYACGPANRMFATLSPTSRFTDTTAGFDLLPSPDRQRQLLHQRQALLLLRPHPRRQLPRHRRPRRPPGLRHHRPRRRPPPHARKNPHRSQRLRHQNLRHQRPLSRNQRRPRQTQVKLKPRELGILDWDHKLTLEFNGDHPSVRSIDIEPIPDEPVIYLAGDSTVVDQYYEPWAAWGQMLPRFFLPGIVIANHAESGETTKSFVAEHRLAKIMTTMKPGDYLFIQFAHNDMKPGAVSLDEYKKLLTDYIAQTRAKGATPVLVTSMNRRTFDDAGHITNSFGPYPDAMREVAAQQKVALIDLNAMSKTLFEAMGPEGTLKAFMHYPADSFPGQTAAISDDTHFNSYGAYELARCIVHGIREANLPLTKFLDPTIPDFNPAHPDPQSDFHLPFTPILHPGDPTKVGQT